jgi:hypothetical protein
MAIIVATLMLFLVGPFVLWPLLKTPEEVEVEAPPPDALRRPPRQAGR